MLESVFESETIELYRLMRTYMKIGKRVPTMKPQE